jgi:hypothetical protein
MEQNPSREADNQSAGQEMLLRFCDTMYTVLITARHEILF